MKSICIHKEPDVARLPICAGNKNIPPANGAKGEKMDR